MHICFFDGETNNETLHDVASRALAALRGEGSTLEAALRERLEKATTV